MGTPPSLGPELSSAQPVSERKHSKHHQVDDCEPHQKVRTSEHASQCGAAGGAEKAHEKGAVHSCDWAAWSSHKFKGTPMFGRARAVAACQTRESARRKSGRGVTSNLPVASQTTPGALPGAWSTLAGVAYSRASKWLEVLIHQSRRGHNDAR